MKKQADFLEKPQFNDSFKGIFGIHVYKREDVDTTINMIKELISPKTP